MDILAHGLWANIIYKAIPETRGDRKTTNWGIFFGIFPDLSAFTPVFAYIFYQTVFLGQKLALVRPEDNGQAIPLSSLTHNLYNFSHSLIIWGVVFLLAWLVFKKLPWVLFGWGLHIGLDIFSHSSKFFPTPFLFPFSKFTINGWSWAEPVFMLVNYGLLLILYLFLVPKLKQKLSR